MMPGPLSPSFAVHIPPLYRKHVFYINRFPGMPAYFACLSLEMTSSSFAALSGLDSRNARKQSSDELTSSYVALAGLSANMLELLPVNEIIYLVSSCE